MEDKLRNYVLGHGELGLDLVPVLEHFAHYLPQARVLTITEEALGQSWTGAPFLVEAEGVGQARGALPHRP